jgi:dihydroorotase
MIYKNTKIVWPDSPWDSKTVDLVIENEIITNVSLSDSLETDYVLFPSFVDIGSFSGDFGREEREDIYSLASAAEKGGFSDVYLMPELGKVVENAEMLHFLKNNASKTNIRFHFIGSLTEAGELKEMADFDDMQSAGCRLFSSGNNTIQNSALLHRCMTYVASVNGVVLHTSMDNELQAGKKFFESSVSTKLGLPSFPKIAEQIGVTRDILLATETGASLIIHKVCTPESIDEIRAYNTTSSKKIRYTTSVNNILFSDKKLESFDSGFLLNPPLLPEDSHERLLQYFLNNELDILVSDHTPLSKEEKDLEFNQAKRGIIGIQTSIIALLEMLHEKDYPLIAHSFAINPRTALHLPIPTFDKGIRFEGSLFEAKLKEKLSFSQINLSKSQNTPFFNHSFSWAFVQPKSNINE